MSPSFPNVGCIVLAAGLGTRMQSRKPKILFKIGDRPLLGHTLSTISQVLSQPAVVVLRPNSLAARKIVTCSGHHPVSEKDMRGNAKTFAGGLDHLANTSTHVLVLNGDDSYLYTPKTLHNLIDNHLSQARPITILTTIPTAPYNHVRKVIRNAAGEFAGLQLTDATQETFCGAYVMDIAWAKQHLSLITPSQNGEYQLVDLLLLALKENAGVNIVRLSDPNQWWGINTRQDLLVAKKLWSQFHDR